MNKENISDRERAMLGNIGELMRLDRRHFDLLFYAYRVIKIQGKAMRIDVGQILSLGVPLVKAIADVKGVSNQDVVSQINNEGVVYLDIKAAFESMTVEGGLYHNPVKS